ncbi:hypothetical protein [Azospirillum sp. B510]|uniref:hypothetical protein n=1 Tax=Azospirillum sp. (strain B510) TaxID=137722 RepID=UPI00030DBC92|nr:hypothetical protein [Azospirillum sp. B510]
MKDHTPGTELLLAAHGASRASVERLATAVALLDGLMVPPHVARLRDAARAWLRVPGDPTLYSALADAVAEYCDAEAPRRTRLTALDLAALAEEAPAWTGRADLQ